MGKARQADDIRERWIHEEERRGLPRFDLPDRAYVSSVQLDLLTVRRRLRELTAEHEVEPAELARDHRVELQAGSIEGVGALESPAAVRTKDRHRPAREVSASDVQPSSVRR